MLNSVTARLFGVLVAVLSLAACASAQAPQKGLADDKPVASGIAGNDDIGERLQRHFAAWQGTPYQYGGLNKRGIDCSGFIYLTYRDVFAQKIPRSTELQAGIGKKISRPRLRLGDLVFFKTGFRQRHAGIYIGQGKFIHASSSRGVTTSRLNSPYWRKHYWKSIRVE